jgi:TolB-like protein/Flp pilus assembly protein TadD
MPSPSPESDEAWARRAVFLSYTRDDTPAAQRIADSLRGQGVEVWFDQSELRGGDVWDQKIRRQIRECVLFLPVVSARTQARGEGYFRLEWRLAAERTRLMAEGVPFLAPVVVDETQEDSALVPEEFLRVQWMRLPGGLPTPPFIEQVRRMLDASGHAVVPPPRAHTGSMARPSGSRSLRVVVAVAIGVLVAAAIFFSRRAPPTSAAPGVVDGKSVAVLPFENMSEDKDNAFFTDGVHEDVLTDLSLIKDLHVVSRTSVMQYSGTTKSIREIGKELGVAYVLEGSVRREGKKVRVTGQLIDARTDEHVWANTYDRDLNDIFAIQGELAQSIAGALQSVISPETKVLLARKPTENTAAYDDYQKARQITNGRFIGTQESSTKLLEDAVSLDPSFAQAWAELGSRRAFARFNGSQTVEQQRLAKEAIDTAVRLAPDDPAVIEGLGDYYYYAFRDYARATEQYMRLQELRPNDATVFYSLGLIQRRQGRIADSVANLRRGYALDPTNHEYASTLAETLTAAHHYDESLALRRKNLETHPGDLESAFDLAFDEFQANGSVSGINSLPFPAADSADHSLFIYMEKDVAALIGDWAKFRRLDHEQRYFDDNIQDPRWNQDVNAADSFAEEGDMAAARTRAGEALAMMKDALVQQADNAQLWSDLSLAYALLGKKEEARNAAQKSADLLPESRDALQGPSNSLISAVAYAWIGEKDRALGELQRLLRTPFGANIYLSRNSFRPLRDNPRYKKMIEDPANNAPLF